MKDIVNLSIIESVCEKEVEEDIKHLLSQNLFDSKEETKLYKSKLERPLNGNLSPHNSKEENTKNI